MLLILTLIFGPSGSFVQVTKVLCPDGGLLVTASRFGIPVIPITFHFGGPLVPATTAC
jgi:hypothetical protein